MRRPCRPRPAPQPAAAGGEGGGGLGEDGKDLGDWGEREREIEGLL